MIDVDGLVFTYPGTKEPAVNDLLHRFERTVYA
jgi:hypothetical protein